MLSGIYGDDYEKCLKSFQKNSIKIKAWIRETWIQSNTMNTQEQQIVTVILAWGWWTRMNDALKVATADDFHPLVLERVDELHRLPKHAFPLWNNWQTVIGRLMKSAASFSHKIVVTSRNGYEAEIFRDIASAMWVDEVEVVEREPAKNQIGDLRAAVGQCVPGDQIITLWWDTVFHPWVLEWFVDQHLQTKVPLRGYEPGWKATNSRATIQPGEYFHWLMKGWNKAVMVKYAWMLMMSRINRAVHDLHLLGNVDDLITYRKAIELVSEEA